MLLLLVTASIPGTPSLLRGPPPAPVVLDAGASPKDGYCIPQGGLLPTEACRYPCWRGVGCGTGLGAALGVSWGHQPLTLGWPRHGRQRPRRGQLGTGPWWEVSPGGEDSQSSFFKPRVCRAASAHPPFAVQLPLGQGGSVPAERAARVGDCYLLRKELLLPWRKPNFCLG